MEILLKEKMGNRARERRGTACDEEQRRTKYAFPNTRQIQAAVILALSNFRVLEFAILLLYFYIILFLFFRGSMAGKL